MVGTVKTAFLIRIYTLILLSTILVTPILGQKVVGEDQVYGEYNEYIKSIQLFPIAPSGIGNPLAPAIVNIRGPERLLLQFDDLFAEPDRYKVRFQHCNQDWTPSGFFDLDILDTYNEFPIVDYAFSFNRHIPFVHYSFELPSFKEPGNYLLTVYRESEEDIVFTRRFMVYNQLLTMDANREMEGLSRIGRMTQEIQFTLQYQRTNLDNPMRNVRTTILQNHRWDNAIHALAPTNVWEGSKTIEYKHFALENQFRGGNEFRFFDLRSIEYFGRNVQSVDRSGEIPKAIIATDKTRNGRAYGEYLDKNGGYIVRDPINAEYVLTSFFLESTRIPEQVYLVGALTNWDFSEPMKYDASRKGYVQEIMIKEGEYDYTYVVNGENPNLFEGDHFQTENVYDILVYYYSFERKADLLLGYFIVSKNSMR